MSLGDIRRQIDETDRELVKLLAQRLRLSSAIGQIKQQTGQPVTNAQREAEVMAHVIGIAGKEGIDPLLTAAVYREIIAASRGVQGITVAFQGEIGAYSQEAALSYFGHSIETRPYEKLEDVFQAVETGEVNFGVVPVENSLEGSISKTYDLLLDSILKVSGEIEYRVSHCLIANPGTTLDGIKSVYSHPQALGQCQAFIRQLNLEIVPAYDTAGSVRLIKEKNIRDGAAIASRQAAEYYGMNILSCGIEDNQQNFTRFFILGQHDAPPTGQDKTSLVFSVKHRPGSLVGLLNELAEQGVNLTKIESRPTRQKPWEYNFYLDFEGYHEDPAAREALTNLERNSIFVKVLGSYPKAK
jgi:chorismate mutase/prephenate dehydratase